MNNMESKPSQINEITSRLPAPPKDKGNTTPNQIIQSGIFTDDQLMCYIEEMIIEGKSYRIIANKLNVKLTSLSSWLSKTEHFTRTKAALKVSADYYADMSIQVLKNAPSDKTELMRARELSSAYRWMARVRDVSKYGERIDVTSDGDKIVMLSLGSGQKPPEETTETDYIDVTDNS